MPIYRILSKISYNLPEMAKIIRNEELFIKLKKIKEKLEEHRSFI
jgi:hypothetical protein